MMARLPYALGCASLCIFTACALSGPPEGFKKPSAANDDAGGGADGTTDQGGDDAATPASSGSGGQTTTSSGGAGGIAGEGGSGGMPGVGVNGQMPPQQPVYRMRARIHVGNSGLSNTELTAILEEMNWIWWSQAAVCFEFETVATEETRSEGFDLWFLQSSSTSYNGYYQNDHDIWTLDQPSLGSAPNPTQYPASRTAAHELGHALTLSHYNGQADSDDSLMSSGRRGWKLHTFEVDDARTRAAQKALADTEPLYCAPVSVE